jgi:RimJ/RimL family protein N-acetyltransferase
MEDLEADGIRIRRFRDTDAAAFAAGTQDPEIGMHSGLAVAHTPQSALTVLEEYNASEGFAERAIADAGTDEMLGIVILFNVARHERRCEVGFWLLPAGRGRGAATAAVRLACDWAMREWGIERFDAHSDIDNPGAHAVLERNGFAREGVLPGWGARGEGRVDAVHFGRLAAPE